MFIFLCFRSLKYLSQSSANNLLKLLADSPASSLHCQREEEGESRAADRESSHRVYCFSWNSKLGHWWRPEMRCSLGSRDFTGVQPCREFLSVTEAELPFVPAALCCAGIWAEGPSALVDWAVELKQSWASIWRALLKNNNSTNILYMKTFTFAVVNMPEQSSLGTVPSFTGSDVFYFSSRSCNSGSFVINMRGNVSLAWAVMAEAERTKKRAAPAENLPKMFFLTLGGRVGVRSWRHIIKTMCSLWPDNTLPHNNLVWTVHVCFYS